MLILNSTKQKVITSFVILSVFFVVNSWTALSRTKASHINHCQISSNDFFFYRSTIVLYSFEIFKKIPPTWRGTNLLFFSNESVRPFSCKQNKFLDEIWQWLMWISSFLLNTSQLIVSSLANSSYSIMERLRVFNDPLFIWAHFSNSLLLIGCLRRCDRWHPWIHRALLTVRFSDHRPTLTMLLLFFIDLQ